MTIRAMSDLNSNNPSVGRFMTHTASGWQPLYKYKSRPLLDP